MQLKLVSELNEWIIEMSTSGGSDEPNDMFIGFNSDTTASLVLNLTKTQPETFKSSLVRLEAIKSILQCATPDRIIKAVSSSIDRFSQDELDFVWDEYFVKQKHFALDQLVKYHMHRQDDGEENETGRLVQITTHSQTTLLSLNWDEFRLKIESGVDKIDLCMLNAFDTQHQFVDKLDQFFKQSNQQKSIMLIQIELAERYDNDLLACVRHLIVDTRKEHKTSTGRACLNAYVFIVVVVPRENIRNVSGFQLGNIYI